MPRKNLLVRLAAALIGIAAVAMAASTVSSPIDTGGTGGSGGGEGSGSGTPIPLAPGSSPADLPPFLEYLFIALTIVFALAIAWYLIANRRQLVRLIAVSLGVALLIGLVLFAMDRFAGFGAMNATPQPADLADVGGEPGEPGETNGDRTSFDFGPVLLLLGLVTAIFVGSLVVTGQRTERTDSGASTAEADFADAVAVGTAAGRAADRIEADAGEAIDNEVYRAWRDMTTLLDVDRPETSTPGEFAEAAVEAGMGRIHVEELTRLFEDVRYGRAETTDDRESRAVDVLRRIEAEYADDADRESGGRSE